jgi:hypothetical protein
MTVGRSHPLTSTRLSHPRVVHIDLLNTSYWYALATLSTGDAW